MNIDVPYGITTRLEGVGLQEARERLTKALQEEGFGILSEIDVTTTLKTKLGLDMEPYVILGACNPKLAHRAITSEPGIGLLLPCNVVITEDGADSIVSIASPRAMFTVTSANGELERVAAEAEERLGRVAQRLRSDVS